MYPNYLSLQFHFSKRANVYDLTKYMHGCFQLLYSTCLQIKTHKYSMHEQTTKQLSNVKEQIINSTAVQMNFKSVKSYCVAPLYDMFTKQEWNCSC